MKSTRRDVFGTYERRVMSLCLLIKLDGKILADSLTGMRVTIKPYLRKKGRTCRRISILPSKCWSRQPAGKGEYEQERSKSNQENRAGTFNACKDVIEYILEHKSIDDLSIRLDVIEQRLADEQV
jgi:hypothetical protein